MADINEGQFRTPRYPTPITKESYGRVVDDPMIWDWLSERNQDPFYLGDDSNPLGAAIELPLKALVAYNDYIYEPFRNALPYTGAYDQAMEYTDEVTQQGFNDYEQGMPIKGLAKILGGTLANTAGTLLDPTDPLEVFGGASAVLRGVNKLRKASKLKKLRGGLESASDAAKVDEGLLMRSEYAEPSIDEWYMQPESPSVPAMKKPNIVRR